MIEKLPFHLSSVIVDDQKLTFPNEREKLIEIIQNSNSANRSIYISGPYSVLFYENPNDDFSNGNMIFYSDSQLDKNVSKIDSKLNQWNEYIERFTKNNVLDYIEKADFTKIENIFFSRDGSEAENQNYMNKCYNLMWDRRNHLAQFRYNLDRLIESNIENVLKGKILKNPEAIEIINLLKFSNHSDKFERIIYSEKSGLISELMNLTPALKYIDDKPLMSRFRIAPMNYLTDSEAQFSYAQYGSFRRSNSFKDRLIFTGKYGVPYMLQFKDGETYDELKDKLISHGLREYEKKPNGN